jgi:hypothetical protein
MGAHNLRTSARKDATNNVFCTFRNCLGRSWCCMVEWHEAAVHAGAAASVGAHTSSICADTDGQQVMEATRPVEGTW